MTRPDDANLRDLLARVHERLSHAHNVDPETRRLLVTITRDIEHALGTRAAPKAGGAPRGAGAPRAGGAEPAGGPDHAEVHRQSLASLEGIAARFDTDHPALAQTLRQLVDLLGKAGI